MNGQGRMYWYRVIFLRYNEVGLEVTVVLPFSTKAVEKGVRSDKKASGLKMDSSMKKRLFE